MKRLIVSSLFTFVLVVGLSTVVFAQGPSGPAPKLPEGMTGSDSDDARSKLPAGLFDAGEIVYGMKHVALLKKPKAFTLGTSDPDNKRVIDTLKSQGFQNVESFPGRFRLIFAQLAFANSDMAFQGDKLFVGNFYGVSIYDIADPNNAKLLTTMVCPGGQGDVSVHGNLMFMSVEAANGRLDCGPQGFEVKPTDSPQAGPAADKDRFRGIRIFDISDVRSPKQVAAVQTCRGSHTHTLVEDLKDKNHVYIYNSGTSFVRPDAELAGCQDGNPEQNKNTSRFSIDVIKVPVAKPAEAKIVASPRIFGDETGKINALNDGGSHENKGVPSDTDQCHDITAYSEIGLAAGACSGNGILLDIKDPANPKRIEAVNDKNYAYWHSATFSNDGKTVVYTDEWGGGLGARCRANDPNVWGANAIFNLNEDRKLEFKSYYKLPAAQSNTENCVAHNGSLIPVPGRNIKVQAWYQGGISIMDFTDPMKPFEIAYFDRGPIDPKTLIMGGSWSAYWYNGHIYSSEIARGLDILELVPSKHLSQNEIDAAKAYKTDVFNVQNQKMIKYPKNATTAKAYLDQLERNHSLSKGEIDSLRIAMAGKTTSKQMERLAIDLETKIDSAKTEADSDRMSSLVAILRNN